MEFKKRKYPARSDYFFKVNRNNLIDLTICTQGRKRILDNPAAHSMVLSAWQVADQWLVGKYVLMPDHIHLLCAPKSIASCSLENWIKYWKTICSKNWYREDDKPLWQKAKWDKRLRKGDSYSSKSQYILDNPVRANLVRFYKQWPYSGEVEKFTWHGD